MTKIALGLQHFCMCFNTNERTFKYISAVTGRSFNIVESYEAWIYNERVDKK